MIVDLEQSAADEPPDYDLCIVGSGPAGGTLAAELGASGLRVCVLESGRERPTRTGDRLRDVESSGIPIKAYSRERVLGGASTTWAGLSSPLDPADLEPRAHVRDSGWPLARAELLGFYEQAAARYRFPTQADFGPDGFAALKAKGELRPEWERLEEKVFLACDEPQDFGRELREVYVSGGVDLYLDATVMELCAEPGARRVGHALVRTSGGRELRFAARAFALATGGLENARLLLASRDMCPAGLGNERDQVGRRLMNHPKNYHGILHLAQPVEELPYYFGCLQRGFAGYAGLRLREEVQRERGLMNSYVRMEPLFPWSDDPGVESLVLFVKHSKGFLRAWKAGKRDEVVELRDYSETGDDSDLQNERKSFLGWLGLGLTVALHARSVAHYLWFRLFARRRPQIRRVRLRNFMEMEPHPDNRVTLSDVRGVYGQPLARVHHDTTERDRRSLVELHDALVEELARAGLGRLETDLRGADPWPITQDASHHMGTTRMGSDPATSVVDPDLRLHGVDNVFLAGASVFPTSGCANPTFTIVALSIRLARHLERALKPQERAR